MITNMVNQAREEARSWQERASSLERTANFDPLLSELYSRRAFDAQLTAAQFVVLCTLRDRGTCQIPSIVEATASSG